MKLTNYAFVTMINNLEKNAGKKLPQKISYAITRNLILFQKDYDCYTKSLNKLFSEYEKHFVKDEQGNVTYNNMGIPVIKDEAAKEFHEELENLLNIEIEIEPFYIQEDVFDYEDNTNRYDSLSAIDIMNLQAILCDRR